MHNIKRTCNFVLFSKQTSSAASLTRLHSSDSEHYKHTFRQFSKNLNQSSVPYFPYCKSNFESIRRNKQFYIDKTHLIPLLERSGEQLIFLRPPRWGKSLLMSMLSSYYDLNKKDTFDELFNGLWIGNSANQTPLRNEYHVLHFDFSIDVIGSPDDIKTALLNKINNVIEDFVEQNGLKDVVVVHPTDDALVSFDKVVYYCRRRNLKLMVLIDEYDRFANKIMFENPVKGKRGDLTHSPISSFLERLKQASNVLVDFRSLIIGITPIALADASCYNVELDISQSEIFGDLVGFTENDLRLALNNIGIVNDHQNNAISIMKRYYEGYHFPGSTKPLFNSTLSLYFLDKLTKLIKFKQDVIEGKDIPLDDMKDLNTEISESVFATLAASSITSSIIQQLIITNKVQLSNSRIRSFKLGDIMHPVKEISWNNILSFMYYHGMVTFLPESSPKSLSVPNEMTKVKYLGKLYEIISFSQNYLADFVDNPTDKNLKAFMESILGKMETIYDNNMSEGGLQATIESAFRAFSLNNFGPFKSIKSKQFADLVLETDNNIYIIEFKRVRPKCIIQYSKVDWFPHVYKQKFQELLELNEKNLLEMKVEWWEDSKVVSVNSILNSAKQLVTQCGEHEKSLNMSKTIHKFVVVQVGWPLIVKKLD